VTAKQEAYSKQLKMHIHTSVRYVNYYKDERKDYKNLLLTHFEVTSSTNLQIDQLIMLRDYMNYQRESLPIQKEPNANETRVTTPQLSTIRSMWNNYAEDTSDEALLKFFNRKFKKRYLHLNVMRMDEAQKLIPILKKMQSQ